MKTERAGVLCSSLPGSLVIHTERCGADVVITEAVCVCVCVCLQMRAWQGRAASQGYLAAGVFSPLAERMHKADRPRGGRFQPNDDVDEESRVASTRPDDESVQG